MFRFLPLADAHLQPDGTIALRVEEGRSYVLQAVLT